jgi:hypothetical protein
MSFKATFNKEQLSQFVLDRFFEQGDCKKNYEKNDIKCFWTKDDNGEEILVICPKKITKKERHES